MAPETGFWPRSAVASSAGTFSSPLLSSGAGPAASQLGIPNSVTDNIVRSSSGSSHSRCPCLANRVRRLALDEELHRFLMCVASFPNMADSSWAEYNGEVGFSPERARRARREYQAGEGLLGGRTHRPSFSYGRSFQFMHPQARNVCGKFGGRKRRQFPSWQTPFRKPKRLALFPLPRAARCRGQKKTG